MFTSFLKHEIQFVTDNDLVISDANDQLSSWQIEGALDHWRIIRTVLAPEVWANY